MRSILVAMSKVIIAGLILGLEMGRFARGQDEPKTEAHPPITNQAAAVTNRADIESWQGPPSESLTNFPSPQSNENTNAVSESGTNSPPVISEPSGPSRRRIIWFIAGAIASLAGLWWYSGNSKR